MQFKQIVFSQHALTRMFERSISPELVRRAIQNGAIIANYPNDQPYPSVLLLFFEHGQAFHIVAGINQPESTCYVITAYSPDPSLWQADFKTRK